MISCLGDFQRHLVEFQTRLLPCTSIPASLLRKIRKYFTFSIKLSTQINSNSVFFSLIVSSINSHYLSLSFLTEKNCLIHKFYSLLYISSLLSLLILKLLLYFLFLFQFILHFVCLLNYLLYYWIILRKTKPITYLIVIIISVVQHYFT